MSIDNMEIEKAEAVRIELIAKRDALLARGKELEDERAALSFSAHAEGDQKALKKLDTLHIEHAKHDSEVKSLNAAIAQAETKLEAAQRDAAVAADRAQAEQLRIKLSRFNELGLIVDDAIWDVASSINEMVTTLNEIHALGQVSPTSEQFRVNGTTAIKSMLQKLPTLWVRDFEFQLLSPGQKKTFKDLCAGWSQMIEHNIDARLGTIKREAA